MFSTRSLFATLLLIAVSFMMVEQGQALISVDTSSVRRAGTPKLGGQGSAFQRPEMENAKVNPLPKESQKAFDTDAYRQAMTELVYQRSMERFA
mmetsp:Transcript_3228/g.7552  ORF Transcript_3228/g.7552 Transcript_3228/m.7552 type:complete len:94 (+) Transcript_3228:142-423(+)|eukprot:CAMPEP_0113605868 /NCGR_PEP_ID=MMETSP0017_2-20120614/2558_1 /TAXON_ID=2856 /ORGANISM="Cylindrotheca closterium" /LENGTH=93 /DNA_ID=CAMNT_0000514389 /DNA_START=81 /DNA_END=362 /DNA_ORIENTATION=+ /assembly_acc=CAM_ASM_000147